MGIIDDLPAEGLFDRHRPYAGQSQTFVGERGQYVIFPHAPSRRTKAVTLRDIYDAVLVGMCQAYGVDPEQLTSSDDLYDRLDFSGPLFDPVAAAQNACCEVEKRLGIYPNLPKRTSKGE